MTIKKLGMILLALALLVNMLSFTGMSTAYAGGLSVKLSPAKVSNLVPDTTYYIYTCTYANGYNASGKTKETTVSKWSEPIQIKTTKVPAPKSLKVTSGTRKMTVK